MNLLPLPFWGVSLSPCFCDLGMKKGRLSQCLLFEFNVTTCKRILWFYLGCSGPTCPNWWRSVWGCDLFPVHSCMFHWLLIDSSWACCMNMSTSKWKLAAVIGWEHCHCRYRMIFPTTEMVLCLANNSVNLSSFSASFLFLPRAWMTSYIILAY